MTERARLRRTELLPFEEIEIPSAVVAYFPHSRTAIQAANVAELRREPATLDRRHCLGGPTA